MSEHNVTRRLLSQPRPPTPMPLSRHDLTTMDAGPFTERLRAGVTYVWAQKPEQLFAVADTRLGLAALRGWSQDGQGWVMRSWRSIWAKSEKSLHDLAKEAGARNTNFKLLWSLDELIEDMADIFAERGALSLEKLNALRTSEPGAIAMMPSSYLKRPDRECDWPQMLERAAEKMKARAVPRSRINEVEANAERARLFDEGRKSRRTPHESVRERVVLAGPDGPQSETDVIAVIAILASIDRSRGFTFSANGPDIRSTSVHGFNLLGLERIQTAEVKQKASDFKHDAMKDHVFCEALIVWDDDRSDVDREADRRFWAEPDSTEPATYPRYVIDLQKYIRDNAERLRRGGS